MIPPSACQLWPPDQTGPAGHHGDQRHLHHSLGHDPAEGATEVGQVFTKLAKEQAQNNIETFQALARTLDWSQVAQIHGDFLRTSMERAAEFTKRYFEVVQTVVASTTSTAKEQARKTA